MVEVYVEFLIEGSVVGRWEMDEVGGSEEWMMSRELFNDRHEHHRHHHHQWDLVFFLSVSLLLSIHPLSLPFFLSFPSFFFFRSKDVCMYMELAVGLSWGLTNAFDPPFLSMNLSDPTRFRTVVRVLKGVRSVGVGRSPTRKEKNRVSDGMDPIVSVLKSTKIKT